MRSHTFIISFVLIAAMTTTLTIRTTVASPYAFYGGAAALHPLPASSSISYGVHSSSLITPTQQQYHAQDDLGQYAYGYSEPLSSKQEVRSLDGTTRGSYSYRDAEGIVQTVDYTADASGFHVSATNLPRAPVAPAVAVAERVQQPFLGPSAPIATADAANVAVTANAANTAISAIAANTADAALIAASHREQSAAAAAAAHTALQAAGLRLASAPAAAVQPSAMDALGAAVELPNTVDDSVSVSAGLGAVPAAFHPRALTSPSALTYRTAAVLPKVYAYGFSPLNARFLSGVYY